MSWVKEKHLCELLYTVHVSVAEVGSLWECDHCKKTWMVVSCSEPDEYSNVELSYENRDGDYVYIRSGLKTQ